MLYLLILSVISEHESPYREGVDQFFPSLTVQERQEYLEEINGELAIHLSVLYFMVEIFRGDESWADELSEHSVISSTLEAADTDYFERKVALDPPLPIHLLHLVAGLREKNAKGYPVKKVTHE